MWCKKLFFLAIFIASCFLRVEAQCKCYNGVNATAEDEPVMTIDLGDGKQIAVCGYDETHYSKNKIKMSDFDVFDCAKGTSIVAFGKNRTCVVTQNQNALTITEETYLPVGPNWKWEFIPLSKIVIKLTNNKINTSPKQPVFKKPVLPQETIDAFFQEIENVKEKNMENEWENVIGKLQVLTMAGNEKAIKILLDFENYFNFNPHDLVGPIYKDAQSMANWLQTK